MKAHSKGLFGIGGHSVARQIVLTESRLDRRKTAARATALSLGSRIQSGLTSPRSLLIAGFAGLLVGDWLHRPMNRTMSEPGTARKQMSARPGKSLNNQGTQSILISKALLVTRLALNLKTAWENANPGGTDRRTK